MFSLLESKAEIARAQAALQATLEREWSQTTVRDIGYPGGNRPKAKVRTDGRHWYWTSRLNEREVAIPRILNWFGRLPDDGGLDIAVELNIVPEGRHDRVAGYFARDTESGEVFLFHSGRVGGGTKGVGKEAFLAWSDLPLERAHDRAGRVREGTRVMPVEGRGAAGAMARYVDTILAFKRAVREGEITKPAFARKLQQWKAYYAEPTGRRVGARAETFDYTTRHGEVVDALARWRTRKGLPVGCGLVKNGLIDLGVSDGGALVELFEVKTGAERSDLYAAIGQLLVHSGSGPCRRTIVLPGDVPLASDLELGLVRLGIEVLRFSLDRDAAVIL